MSKKVAVITGASQGIGKATAAVLKRQGFRAIGVSRRFKDTAETRPCDVQDESSVRDCFESIIKQYGRIDVLVNCAGVVSFENILELGQNEWDAALQTNLVGTYYCCKHALKPMIKHGYGKIVTLSSIAGRACSRTASLAYTCSKYGVIGLTRQLAADFGRKGVNVNCVCPSQTKTEMLKNVSKADLKRLAEANPLRRLAEPREIAEAVAFLASDAASYINGAVLDVNGGLL